MRIWATAEPGNKDFTFSVTRLTPDSFIEREYWPWWKEQMILAGREEFIDMENCIMDWVTVNWAWLWGSENEVG